MKKIILIGFIIALSINAFAQDVEGVLADQKMTYAQVVAKFGKPDKYRKHYDEFGLTEDYYYVKTWLHFEETGKFKNFVIEDRRFAALTLDIDGGIRVGDPLSKLDNFKYGKPQYMKDYENGDKQYSVYNHRDDHVYLMVKDGIIVAILYDYPV
ncbi:MAG: hypothetical protein LKI42_03410 [Bacteroidales bacterium]|jgi:hypothetical protein|nr:hypothetical protein [Bacteroidales bacterium]MCI1785702.1 hypothetical protein [Bacteroidales bacterium]